MTSGVLVSVRDVGEARAALAGGAALIDVKEPARGALGRADDDVVAAVVSAVDGRAPVSAALGELTVEGVPPDCPGLSFVKWGLAGCARFDWRDRLERALARPGPPQTVVAAYADWQCAQAPSLADVVDFACGRPGSVLLIDTCCKDTAALSLGRKPTLLDWVSAGELAAICRRCRAAGVRTALAGSLDEASIRALLPARPTWFAVRGAACAGGERGAEVRRERVASLARLFGEGQHDGVSDHSTSVRS
jgi:uncharacterized protein (UPF0264 family)